MDTALRRLPRFRLAFVHALQAVVFAAAALALPLEGAVLPAVLLGAVALANAVTVAAALSGREEWTRRAWHATALVSLTFLLLATWALLGAAVYVQGLYTTIGGVTAALLAVLWAVCAFVTLPSACWALSYTFAGSRLSRVRRWRELVGGGSVLVVVSLLLLARSARAETVEQDSGRLDALARSLQRERFADGGDRKPVSLSGAPAAECGAPVGERRTALVFFADGSGAARARCVQAAGADELEKRLRTELRRTADGAPIKLDFVTRVLPLTATTRLLDAHKLRSGLDGVCSAKRCLAPWQLSTRDFYRPRDVPDFMQLAAVGYWPRLLQAALGESRDDVSGLTRIETRSYVLDRDGVRSLSGFVLEGEQASRQTTRDAAAAAEQNILTAQLADGKFRYTLDPFTSRADESSLNLPRQAGTTYALCTVGSEKGARRASRRSLAFMATFEHARGDYGLLTTDGNRIGIGATALPLIAYLECRRFVGDRYDALIGRLARFVLLMQREDGSFYPLYDWDDAAPTGSHEALFSAGQAVLGLVRLEQLIASGAHPELPSAEAVRGAVARAMAYYGRHYWSGVKRDFFFLEENWHCLAARAALTSHRDPDYERFCIDYVAFKNRLIELDPAEPSHRLGGLTVSPLAPAGYTPTAGHGEALAAALALQKARGEDRTRNLAVMRELLGFLVRVQWQPESCFACKDPKLVVGAYSQHLGAPEIRIDYVQHALSALGNGGRELGFF